MQQMEKANVDLTSCNVVEKVQKVVPVEPFFLKPHHRFNSHLKSLLSVFYTKLRVCYAKHFNNYKHESRNLDI